MKFSTIISEVVHTTDIKIRIAIIASMLIVLPVGVFAQSSIEDTSIISDSVTGAEQSLEIAPPVKNPYYDNYKREKLPKSSKVFNDFVIGPGRFVLEIAPGESQTVLLKVSNRMGEEKLFSFTTEDIASNDESLTSSIKLLGDEIGPYTLKDYISVPYDRFYLNDNERAIVPVTISIPYDAEPGGFYGTILTEVVTESVSREDSDVAPSSPLVSRIGTLFYITTPGGVTQEGSLIDFTTLPDKSFYLEGPVDMGLVYENTGSVHITPFGEVVVTNVLGETVGQVDLDPWYVFPKSIRTREISWNREFLIGRYTATAKIQRGFEDVVDTQSVVFWVFPWKFLTVVFAGVFVFFLTIRFIARNFEFKRK